MKKILLINALILTGTSLILRTINMSFGVYVSNKIGAEGVGLYQLVISVYALAITFATSGVSIAVTRLTAEEMGKKSPASAIMVLKKSFAVCLVSSITTSVVLFIFADYISLAWLHDARTAIALRILAPSLPFIGLSACLKGYFIAVRQVIKTASSNILEQIIEISIVINALNIFAPRGLAAACAAVVLGTTASEMASCAYMFMLYRFEARKYPKYTIVRSRRTILKQVLYISVPIAGSSYLRAGLRTLENVMIPSGLKKFGASSKTSLAEYGMIRGMVMPILAFPSAFLSAFSTILVPEIAEANALNHEVRVRYVMSRVFQATSILAILIVGIFVTFAGELGTAIYNSRQAGIYIKVLAPLIPFLYLDSIVDGMMKALNQQMSSLRYDIMDSALRVGMVYFMIPAKGVTALIIIMYVSSIFNLSLSISRLLRVKHFRVDPANWLVIPIIAAAASGSIAYLVFMAFNRANHALIASLIIGIILTVALYFAFLLISGSIAKEDIDWFKSCFRRNRHIHNDRGIVNMDL